MLVKPIKYIDYNDEEREENFYFNFTQVEIMELQLNKDGGLKKYIEEIIAAKDTRKIYECFKDILMKAYGKKSDDGRRFEKSEEISKSFVECPAFNTLIMDFIEKPERAADFVNSLLPKEMPTEASNVVDFKK